MKLSLFQVDAFTSKLFAGNPAAVCPLECWLPDDLLQKIAAENNLAETAFFIREGDGYHLRWFTPGVEVDLCGHATLASAWVIMNELDRSAETVSFRSRGGELSVSRAGDLYTLNFPSRMPERLAENPQLEEALGTKIVELWGGRDYMAVLASEEAVRALKPSMEKLRGIDRFAVIVTAEGCEYDFVSRFFAPAKGVDEDPVTGSAHCTLAPFWAGRLAKNPLRGFQASSRGGEVHCEVLGDRVLLSGQAVKYLEGTIYV